MILAAEAAANTSNFTGFDPFVIVFTILIALGLYRIIRSPRRNPFAIAFASVSLLVFLFMDAVMISGW
ncbi:hypothetical protein SD70_06480 [Gordoniibacillus kamchatkensis]|uniref:DUF2759 domain-containing protein n=1 Tax=Gordoniibacillus kamchatkensis TaxID=1590651 RepID=A0ABR5AMC6_9BACL|nr:hypothetical protein [Paenibacillus sp. VKM B-2647]KIL41517.1 hypothetical protein SD70_06480 [Paenibacillus sp. VKM B-2647]